MIFKKKCENCSHIESSGEDIELGHCIWHLENLPPWLVRFFEDNATLANNAVNIDSKGCALWTQFIIKDMEDD